MRPTDRHRIYTGDQSDEGLAVVQHLQMGRRLLTDCFQMKVMQFYIILRRNIQIVTQHSLDEVHLSSDGEALRSVLLRIPFTCNTVWPEYLLIYYLCVQTSGLHEKCVKKCFVFQDSLVLFWCCLFALSQRHLHYTGNMFCLQKVFFLCFSWRGSQWCVFCRFAKITFLAKCFLHFFFLFFESNSNIYWLTYRVIIRRSTMPP